MIIILVDKNWKNEVKSTASEIDKAIRKQDFIEAKRMIEQLHLMKKDDPSPEIRRDASVAIDNIIRKYGSDSPKDFLSPDWKGDFKAIKKQITISSRLKNRQDLLDIIARMNIVLKTNTNPSVREDAILSLIQIASTESRLLDEDGQIYIEAMLEETDKNVLKQLNELLRILYPGEYSESYEETLGKLSKREKNIKLIPKYDFDNDFIRYKVQVLNNTDVIIWDVRFKITKYEKNFVLREIKPEIYPVIEENTVLLSVLQPGDIKEIIIKVEPKSPQIYLEGRLLYKKYDENTFLTRAAEDLVVDILDEWPEIQILSEKVSIVHCREFFDFHVKYKSMNAFALPESISPEVAYIIGKRILSDFHFTLVMDVINQENFFGEALFYGRVTSKDSSQKEEEIIVILRCSHENNALEINIGCNKNSYLVALQIKFDNMLRQLIMSREELVPGDKLIELRCPNCFQAYDKLSRDWCPWCGETFDKTKLLS